MELAAGVCRMQTNPTCKEWKERKSADFCKAILSWEIRYLKILRDPTQVYLATNILQEEEEGEEDQLEEEEEEEAEEGSFAVQTIRWSSPPTPK